MQWMKCADNRMKTLQVFAVPEEATSAIVVETYKRYILVNLLLRGKV